MAPQPAGVMAAGPPLRSEGGGPGAVGEGPMVVARGAAMEWEE